MTTDAAPATPCQPQAEILPGYGPPWGDPPRPIRDDPADLLLAHAEQRYPHRDADDNYERDSHAFAGVQLLAAVEQLRNAKRLVANASRRTAASGIRRPDAGQSMLIQHAVIGYIENALNLADAMVSLTRGDIEATTAPAGAAAADPPAQEREAQ